jgi:hypothetical protein
MKTAKGIALVLEYKPLNSARECGVTFCSQQEDIWLGLHDSTAGIPASLHSSATSQVRHVMCQGEIQAPGTPKWNFCA